ncbi:NUDIX hydrolase [Domibacillus sp. DTU_2020_1001157_1_SI_ALB_TIR_016]|uniref:NUDIX hydrolase n=1 Tax=Domibacillus sp. DTU_2020_1001157_1_SI_ALB_TIR_016 TaxID=3077789 RepID=UPI0028E8930F|nr:NUDIX hydrolase [Domibacillus sp. DTU_2020_1001157_1_SI_ALB_TIR_016]WNS81624.1 NUDIX hydrolase [Domibacillus sp. DTU_2020_1001157_1_SI_ALB_TIR_016]
MKRGKVWLAAAGLVIDSRGRWLVVKKAYGGLKGQWSLPAGFVDAGETVDEAAVREVREETGIEASVCGVAGIRSGVIQHDVSDTMVVFHMMPTEEKEPKACGRELLAARWMAVSELQESFETSVLLRRIIESFEAPGLTSLDISDPGPQFGYTAYRFFG